MANANLFTDSSSDGEFNNENSEDLSYGDLTEFPEFLTQRGKEIRSLLLNHNEISVVPQTISVFSNLITLDLSNNNLAEISEDIICLRQLRTLLVKNNNLTVRGLPKDFGRIQSLEVINFSGNNLDVLPEQFTELERLRGLHLGGNKINSIPNSIRNLQRLEVLYLGGNSLVEIPAEMGSLHNLCTLNLSDNKLQSLPPTFINLRRLQSLNLHNNNLSTLPMEIVSLNLIELSLRNNPLVKKFVQDMTFQPPALMELAGRCVKTNQVKYSESDVPLSLFNYLNSAQRCVNPSCKGVYFSARVEQVKFVDFCGKYRLPLLHYLCSPRCRIEPSQFNDQDVDPSGEDNAQHKMRRVLLG